MRSISLEENLNTLLQVVIATGFSSGGSQRQAASRWAKDVPEDEQLKANKAATVQRETLWGFPRLTSTSAHTSPAFSALSLLQG